VELFNKYRDAGTMLAKHKSARRSRNEKYAESEIKAGRERLAALESELAEAAPAQGSERRAQISSEIRAEPEETSRRSSRVIFSACMRAMPNGQGWARWGEYPNRRAMRAVQGDHRSHYRARAPTPSSSSESRRPSRPTSAGPPRPRAASTLGLHGGRPARGERTRRRRAESLGSSHRYPTALRAPAATLTRPTRRCESRIFPPESWWSARIALAAQEQGKGARGARGPHQGQAAARSSRRRKPPRANLDGSGEPFRAYPHL